MKIYAVRIRQRIPEFIFNRLFSCLSDDKKKRCQRFVKIEDAERLMVADVLVRYHLCQQCGYHNNALSFDATPDGKPFLKNNPHLHFNVSHADEWVTAAFDQTEIGIDVEKIGPVDIKIAEQFFSKNEYNDLLRHSGREQKQYFFDLWVLKESYLKAVGKGLSMGLDTISFCIEKGLVSFASDNPHTDYFFKQYDLDPAYKMAVCAKHEHFPLTIELVDIDALSRVCDPGF